MKNEIINFIMAQLHINRIRDWPYESAKNFCKLILDSEGIDYQEEDFHTFGFAYDDKKTPEIVRKYAEKYRDEYQDNDPEKTIEMEKVITCCNQIKKIDNDFDILKKYAEMYRDAYQDNDPEKTIEMEKGKVK